MGTRERDIHRRSPGARVRGRRGRRPFGKDWERDTRRECARARESERCDGVVGRKVREGENWFWWISALGLGVELL